MSSGFYINIAPTTGAFFNNSLSNDALLFTQSNSQKIIMGINSNSTGNIVLSSNATTFNTTFTNSGILSNIGQTYFNSNVGIYNQNPQYSLDVNGSINFIGQMLYNGYNSANSIAYQTGGQFGTTNTPINGGTLSLNTLVSLSAIIELSSSAGSLNINLTPANSFNANQTGNIGDIVIIERNTSGRSITLDPRIQFSTNANGIATGFTTTGYYSSTCSNYTTSSPPAAGGFAVDIISYNISKTGFGLGRYSRMFRYMPPSFINTIPTQIVYSGPATYNISTLFSSYSNYFGPLTYTLSGAPGNISLNSNTGVVTFSTSMQTTFAGIVSVTGIGGTTSTSIPFNLQYYNTPVVATIASQNGNTASAAYIITPSQTAINTGIITWSLTCSPANTSLTTTYFNSSTGVITVPIGIVITTTNCTITATGPSSLYNTKTFSLTVFNYSAPTANIYASASYSVRLLSSTWTGAVLNIRRSSDNSTSDFYSDPTQSSGDLWTLPYNHGTNLTNWLNGATGYVVIWYDQSGNGNNATNTNTGVSQPNMSYQSNKWVIQWQNGNGTVLNITNPIQPYTVISEFWDNNLGNGGTIVTTQYDYELRFFSQSIYGGNNGGDWFYCAGGTKLYTINGQVNTSLPSSSWLYLCLSTTSPAWNTSQTSGNYSSFNRLGMDGYSAIRSINGYMTEILFHNQAIQSSDMAAYYNNRLI